MNALGALSPWRFAARLARREVRRRPGRTALVVVLIAIPIMAMTIGSVIVRTADTTDTFALENPVGTDLVVTSWSAHVADGSLDAIPPDATVTTFHRATAPIETASGGVVNWVAIDDGGSIGEQGSAESVTAGRAPEEGEAWLSTALADELNVGVGDQLELRHPSGAWTVVGLGRVRDDFDTDRLVLPGLDLAQFRTDSSHVATITHVDLRPEATREDISRLRSALDASLERSATGGWVTTSDEPWDERGTTTESLAWGWVAGALVLAAAGIIIAAAFATSARRQLVTIGLLSSNGAPGRLVRAALALQGFWTGLVGSALGVTGGVAVLLAGRSVIEELNNAEIARYSFVPFDIVVIVLTGTVAATLAALMPARSASTVPVLAALAGRRPLGVLPRRMVPAGVGAFALGVLLLVIAAIAGGGNGPAAAAVLGGLFVLGGMCCCTPVAVEASSRAAASVGRSWRFAGRSMARTRTRSAAVTTAIAVAGSLAVAGSAVALRIGDDEDARQAPADAVFVRPQFEYVDDPRPDYGPLVDETVDPVVRAAVDEIAPNGTWYPRRAATWDPPAINLNADADAWMSVDLSIVVADESAIEFYELTAADREALDDVGMLALQSYVVAMGASGIEALTLRTEDGRITLPYSVRDGVEAVPGEYGVYSTVEFTGIYGYDQFMITEAAARQAGLDIVTSGGIFRNGAAFSSDQRAALDQIAFGDQVRLAEAYADLPPPRHGGDTMIGFDYRRSVPPLLAIQSAIIGAALLITLLVVAIGLSLSASESRDERDVLVAVGARPRTLRSMAGVKATVITTTGLLLAVPTGVIPVFAVMHAMDEPYETPWLAVGALVLVVPLVAGAASWFVSSIAQRVRPVHMSTLAVD